MAETDSKSGPSVTPAAVPPAPKADSPRDVANKSDKERLLRAIRMSLDIESATVRANTQHFNRSRYRAAANFPEYDDLKDEARRIKDKSIANLPDLIQTLKNSIRSRSGHVFVANTAADACRYILDVCRWRAAKMVVKGKSMTSEEIHLNEALEKAGFEVALPISRKDYGMTAGGPVVGDDVEVNIQVEANKAKPEEAKPAAPPAKS